MRAALLALLAFAAPLRAGDVGVHVEFGGRSLDERVVMVATVPGEVVWTSGPSDPIEEDFAGILIQGRFDGPGLALEASVKDGAAWGPWIEASGESSSKGRFWSKVAVTGKKGASVRLRALAGETGTSALEVFGVYVTDFEEERAGGIPFRLMSATSVTTAPKPEVLPRTAWDALPAAKPYEPMTPERISIHHTEAPQASSREAAIEELQGIQRFHQRGRGWIDIAYHFLIDGSGRVWEGRPLVVGAHVKDKNDGNVGISLMGDFSAGKRKPTAAQLESLIKVTRWLSQTYSIPAERIKGHRDQEITACPGASLYARLEEVRRAATGTSGLYASTRRAGSALEEPEW